VHTRAWPLRRTWAQTRGRIELRLGVAKAHSAEGCEFVQDLRNLVERQPGKRHDVARGATAVDTGKDETFEGR
jgi:hypothetical protein